MAITEGQKAPEFTLMDQANNRVTLSDFKGGFVVLYFYPRDNTSGCTKEAVGFRELQGRFRELGVVILGVSPDSPASHTSFIEKQSLPFSLLSDPEKKVMSDYDAFGEKMMYGKKTIGVIRSTVLIDAEGIVVKHWKKVSKAEDHPAKVLEAIEKMKKR